MKRQTVVLIWAAALLLLVASCFGIYYIWDGSTQGFTKTKSTVAFNCVSTDIEEYTVIGDSGSYTIEKTRSGWQLDDDSKVKLDQDIVGKMIASASNITATGTVSRRDFEKLYTKEERRVKLEFDNDRDVEIRFLGVCGNLCAFRVLDNNKIYVMNSSMRDILAPKLDSLRITTVFPKLAKNETLPDYYRYTDYNGSVVEVRTKTGAELAKGKDNRYVMEKPYQKEVDDEAFEQQIALKIPTIKITGFVDNPSDNIKVYALDEKSRAELSFKWDGYDETLYLGRTENGVVFAVKKNSKDIFTIDTSMLEFLKFDPFYILEDSVLKTDSKNIRSVKVTVGEMVYDITSIDRNSENPQFYVNGNVARQDVFEEIIDELDSINFLSELTSIPQDTRDVVVTVNYNNGVNSQTISLAKLNNKSYAAFIDGKAEFEVDGEAVLDLLQELKDASNNPMKKY
ncbi:MAG: DUF4340 domain-containing protein [Clostridia bacterium]|nr:DUF4340 domain-containing protein [Clostridia bacterium]